MKNIEDGIIQLGGKVLLQIYLIWKKERKISDFDLLLDVTKLSETLLEQALSYCKGEKFLDVAILYVRNRNRTDILIKDITAAGINIIEKEKDETGKRPFNVAFNLNDEFKIESILKGETKLF